MTQKERIEQLEKITTLNDDAITNLSLKFIALKHEWEIYENKYIRYLAKRNRFKNFLWWLFCKITFRSTKLTEKELIKRTAKKMACVFYKGGQR